MKPLFTLIIASLLSSLAFATTPQCSDKCKVALIDAEFEFAYHSGASSTQIAEMVFNSCGENEAINKECAKLINRDEGTITYLYYAGCVHEKVKKDCEEKYDTNRSR